MLHDLRLALRTLAKQPLFSLVAVLTLAVAIGANTTIFSIANWALMRGVPGVRDGSALVSVQLRGDFGGGTWITFGPTYPGYEQYRARSVRTSGIAGTEGGEINFAGAQGSTPERIAAEFVTDNYFSVLGVPAAAGRLLGAADSSAGAPPAVVLSERLWRRALGGDRGALGKPVTINGRVFTVAGIAGGDFAGAEPFGKTDLWMPIQRWTTVDPNGAPLTSHERTAFRTLIARMRPGVTLAAVQAEAQALIPIEGRYFGGLTKPPTIGVVPGIGQPAETRRSLERMMLMLLGGVGLVLLIACANVANLFLARGAVRRREVALRRSLGASSGALARQLLAEGAVLGGAAVVGGVTLALWGTALLKGIRVAPSIPELPAVPVDGRVLAFTVALAALTTLLFSLPPLVGTVREDPAQLLRDGGHGATGRSRLQSALVVVQVAVSFTLVVGAALFLRTVHNLRAVDLGFNPDNVVGFSLDLGAQGYEPGAFRDVTERLVARLRARPGVLGVATAGSTPFDGMIIQNVHPEGTPPPANPRETSFTPMNSVSASFFRTMGIPIVRGRGFTEAEYGSNMIAVVNQAMADRFWPGQDPIGKRLDAGEPGKPRLITVVGVAPDVKVLAPTEDRSPFYYMPEAASSTVNVFVRATGSRAALVSALREEVAAIDPRLPLFNVVTLRERADRTFAQQLTAARLTSVFGVIGLLLAVVGLYAVIAFTVAQRTRELAIRVALGAAEVHLRADVVRDALRLVAAGVALGALGAWGLSRVARSGLYGVTPTDVPTYLGAAVAMALLAIAASYVPARRATRVDPMLALRAE